MLWYSRGRPRPPYSVGPVIQPKPASNTVRAHDRAAARSAASCSGVRSGKRLTLSEPSPHTNVSSGRLAAWASRKDRASGSNCSGVGTSATVEAGARPSLAAVALLMVRFPFAVDARLPLDVDSVSVGPRDG